LSTFRRILNSQEITKSSLLQQCSELSLRPCDEV
jgi:hypothetical protein